MMVRSSGPRAGSEAMLAKGPSIEHAGVDLVAQDEDAGVLAQYAGEPCYVFWRKDAAGGVGWRVEDHQFGALAQAGAQLVEVEAELVLLAQRHEDRACAGEVHHRLVDRERGVWHQDLIALLDEREYGEEHDRLPPWRDDYLRRIHLDGPAACHVGGYRLAQLRDAGCRGVVGVSVSQRPAASLDDVGWRVEVWLADLQVDNLPPLSLERPGLRKHGEGRLGSQALHPSRKLHPNSPLLGLEAQRPLHHTP